MAKKIVDETLKFNIIINGDDAKKEYGQLERANKKFLEANKDLEAQAKKLEKANKTNSESYKKLKEEINANAQAVDKNKNRMQDLTQEIGINNLTMRQLGKEAGRLTGILKGLDPNSEDWKRYSTELTSVKGRMATLRDEMQATEITMEDQEKALGQLLLGFGQLFSGIKSGNYTEVSDGMRTITSGIQGATKAAWAFIATPIGVAIAALAAVGFIAKQWFDYNDSVKESIILTQQITKLQGEQADAIRLRNAALKETFGTDEKETLEVARNLVQQFGITYEEALDTIADGLIKGQGNNTEYLDSLREYPVFFAKAGFSVQEFKDIVSAGYDLGIYSDKLPDAIKEFDISIREQTKSTREALINAFGQTFTDELLARVNTGKTTTKEALQEISEESKKVSLTIEQNQRLTADVFRGAGEDVGGAVKIFEALNKSYTDANRALTPLEQSITNVSDANLELAKAQDAALKSDNYVSFTKELQIFWTNVKTQFYNAISFITDIFTNWTDFLVSNLFATIQTFQQLPTIIKQGFFNIKNAVLDTIKTFSGLSDVFEKLIKLDFSGAKKSAIDFKNNFSNAFNDVTTSASDTFNQILATREAAQRLAQEKLNNNRKGNVAAIKFEEQEKAAKESAAILAEEEKLKAKLLEEANKKAAEKTGIEAAKATENALKQKQAVQDAIDKFDEEQAIRDQLKQVEKDQRAEEEEVIRKELEFVKLTEEAAGDTELLAQLETAKLNEIQAIRDGFAEQREAKEKEKRDKLLAIEKQYKQESIKAEENFQNAKRNALNAGLNVLQDVFGKETSLGKAAFLFQKGKAIQEIIQTTALANAKIASSLAAANSIAVAASPLTFGQPWVTTNTVNAAKNTASNNINSAVNIGLIAATALKGFEDGLYPVTRQQDGKRFNAAYSTNTSTQLLNQPTILAGERPEMIIDPNTLKRMDPAVTDYILQLAGKRPMAGFENGSYNTQISTELPSTTLNTVDAMSATAITRLNNLIEAGLQINFTLSDMKEFDKLKAKLDDTINASKN